jgi:hypothetical protein
MTETDRRFHETWLGMVQPVDGLVVSIPVLVDHQCMRRAPTELQARLRQLCPERQLPGEPRPVPVLTDLDALLQDALELAPTAFDRGDALPDALSLYVPEGKQTLRPTLALRHFTPPPPTDDPELTPAAHSGRPYVALVWDLPENLPLDKPEDLTGPWHYPPAAKFERLLRQCRVPIGLLINRRQIRLIYAPHGESPGSITFRLDDMLATGGRPILDAFVMLLHQTRWFGVAESSALPALLAESRKRQAEVTNALADQVFEALEILLHGFEAAAERDGDALLRELHSQPGDPIYAGLLTVLLRLVFMLYAEDRGLLPVDHPVYAAHYSVLALFEQLQNDAAAHPDAMARRFGAWSRLVATWRTIYLGVHHDDLHMPPREGDFFNPNTHPFLEGRHPGDSSPLHYEQHRERAAVRVPSVDDRTIHLVLERLLYLERQRLSYRALDVEQIGSVYEALMGYHVVRLPARGVCLKPQRARRVWLTAAELLTIPKAQRADWLQDQAGLAKQPATKLAEAVNKTKTEDDALEVLAAARLKTTDVLAPGRLVLQPGSERRRTSSHYTPRSLTEPIVRKTLEPLLAAMGPAPASHRLLSLKICDPAMGSGAFLVEVVRYLGDQLVTAWTREGDLSRIADAHEDVVMHARRLVAQRCVYGVDKNRFAVDLARLSLWLVTLAKNLPFTFVDHALRHGDTLVGLSLDQIRAFHWDPGAQLELVETEIQRALDEAVSLRQQICDLAEAADSTSHRTRSRLLRDADDAASRARLLADVIIGAFFSKEKPKDREQERKRRLDLVTPWLSSGKPPTVELLQLQAEITEQLPTFHWPLEFPEIFFAERADPLEDGTVNKAAAMDAFVGNPPFAGKNNITAAGGPYYLEWLQALHKGAHGNADLSAHFFRRADTLLGAHGTIGLIATNTIGQGDTRATGLQYLVAERGYTIYDATRSMHWPEAGAAVTISVIHLAQGSPAATLTSLRLHDPDPDNEQTLLTRTTTAINSRLRPTPERADPQTLAHNADLSFVGSYVLGMGFVLTPDEREALVAKNPRNAERIFPYLGGEEVNSNPDHGFDRYVINFGQMELSEVEPWPDLIKIVREKVKPERDQNNREVRKKYWWRFGEVAPALYTKIAKLSRCVVTSQVTKHLCFSFQPTDRVFSQKLIIFPVDTWTGVAALQSRAHACWTWLLSSTMKTDLNYSPSDCFQTFPFPKPDPRTKIPALEAIGERLYTARAKYMLDTQQGLTKTYNALKDPASEDPAILALRALHIELDRAVLHAYGWHDIEVPPYTTPRTPAERLTFETFEDAVLDRLFALNAERAAEEERQGLVTRASKKPTATAPTATTPASPTKPRPKKSTKPAGTPTAQLPLGGTPDPDPKP